MFFNLLPKAVRCIQDNLLYIYTITRSSAMLTTQFHSCFKIEIYFARGRFWVCFDKCIYKESAIMSQRWSEQVVHQFVSVGAGGIIDKLASLQR